MFHNVEANDVNEYLERDKHHTKKEIVDVAILLHAKILPDTCFIIEEPVINQQNGENQ